MNCLANRRVLAFFAWLLWSASVIAAPPRITRLTVRGLQTNGTTRITVQGSDLLPDPQLIAELPIVAQKVIGTPRANAVDFDVTLGAHGVPGVYYLRLATSEGITSPELIAVDHLPQRSTPAANAEPEKLPVALHGLVAGSTVQEYRFEGRQGERITIDVMARRLGSKLRPVAHLYDTQRLQLAWSLPSLPMSGDCRLTSVLPADGTYTVAIHDLTYAAPAPGYFRVAIGSLDYVDQVFPAVVSRKGSTPLQLLGRLGGQRLVQLDATAVLQTVQNSPAMPLGDWRPLPWPAGSTPVGLRPRVQLSDFTELVEGVTLDAQRQLPTLGVAVNGSLVSPGEVDEYQLAVVEGDKLRAEVFAERLGSPIDATLEFKNDKGQRLATNDDAIGADPRLEYTVAKGITRVTIAVSDVLRRGEPGQLYRLLVTSVDAAAARPDFKLTLFEDTHHIAADGLRVVRVEAERNGYEGPIRLTLDDLPDGFTAEPVEIAPGANGALLAIGRRANSERATIGRIVVRGTSVNSQPTITRVASLATSPLGDLQPWLNFDVALAPLHHVQPMKLTWEPAAREDKLYFGLDRKWLVRIDRQPGSIGPLRLSLVTSQPPPIVNRQPSVNQTLRGAQATIDLPLEPAVRAAADALAQAEKMLNDLKSAKPKAGADEGQLRAALDAASAKRDEAAKKLREAEANQKNSAEFTVVVPGDLKPTLYDVALKAELRSLDNQTTLAEAYTSPLRLAARPPIDLVLSPTPAASLTLDPKAGGVVRLTGNIKRLGGFAGEVTVTLAGLPAGVTVPRQVIQPKEDKFQLEYKLPPTFAVARVEGVQIVATMVPDARRATINARAELAVEALSIRKVNP